MHLYYASVFGQLLGHPAPLYEQYYAIRHLVTPYCLHYYLLIALMHLVRPEMADKLVVCLILVLFSFGFRSIATAVGSAGRVLSLFVLGVVLNWPLMMGFENYCLALSLALWALGLWTRCRGLAAMRWRVGFVGLVVLIALTHPVALLVALAFCGLDLALRVGAGAFAGTGERRLPLNWLSDLVTYLFACGPLAFIFAFTDRSRGTGDPFHSWSIPHRYFYFASLHGLSFVSGGGAAAILYRTALSLVLGAALTGGLWACWRTSWRDRESWRTWSVSATWLVFTLLVVLLLPWVPEKVNGSYNFAVRMEVLAWIGALAAASACGPLRRKTQSALAAVAMVFALAVLVLAQSRLETPARRVAMLLHQPFTLGVQAGLLLPATDAFETEDASLAFSPYYWAGAHYFRQNGAVMLNSPWLDSSILPLRAQPGLLPDRVNFEHLGIPWGLRQDFESSAALREFLLPQTQAIFFVDPRGSLTAASRDEVLALSPAAAWDCERGEWYTVCRKR